MEKEKNSEITKILKEWNEGNTDAKELLMPYVYDELRRQAKILMSNERKNHTLQPTALVHEAFIKLTKQSGIKWKNRSHFFGIASRLMRQILVQYARLNAAEKRGSKTITFSIDDVDVSLEERANLIINLDEALDRFAELDEEQAKIVEFKFFGGLTNKEVAEALDVSERTVVNRWKIAKLWLYRELKNR